MANFRCNKANHSKSLIKNASRRVRGHIYVARVEPINYPNTSVICGRKGCPNPGLVHLDEEEWQSYQRHRQREFYSPNSSAVKIRVGEVFEIIPR